MSEIVIQIDNVWKKYRLGVTGTGTLRHDLNRWWHRVRGKPDPYSRIGTVPMATRTAQGNNRTPGWKVETNGSGAQGGDPPDGSLIPAPSSLAEDEIWALRSISLEVKRGQIIGIIGRNGAGKSTLLKILSRVTAPSYGEVKVKGRVASLLEVGTGFHPELTGRENIFLNGAILGMTKADIRRKLDEIISFAEVHQFIDTPVKRYSSGMYVRLAFAVAAHLEPEILIIDEVLAVGDAQFQRKCLGKMDEVAKGGRTVFFVSHNMAAIGSLCDTGLLLVQGSIAKSDRISGVIAAYNQQAAVTASCDYVAKDLSTTPHFTEIHITQSGKRNSPFSMDLPIDIELSYETQGRTHLTVTVLLRNDQGCCVHHTTDAFANVPANNGPGRRLCIVPPYALAAGSYFVTVALTIEAHSELFDKLSDVLHFRVEFTGKLAERTTASAWKGVCGPGLLIWE